MALGAFQIRQNTNLLPIIPAGFSSSTNEPSTAMSGRNRFQTGNWYAAYSSNGGASFTHLSPFTAFASIDGGFCCDQDTLYDPSRNMFIWLLQYIKSSSTAAGTGGIRIALFRSETANISNAGWISYVIRPNNLGGPASGEWFDYPHMALGEDFLYIAINVFTTTSDSWTRTIFMRIDLDQLRAGGAVGVQYLSSTSRFNFTPVQGAKDVIYFASQVSGSVLQILRWPENSNTITAFNRNVAAWLIGGQHDCPGPDGNDFCQRSDNRVLAGALGKKSLTRQQEVWFFWNVQEGGGFPLPYIEGARFRESDLAYVRRPFIWSGSATFHYVGAAPNSRGDLGLSLAFNTPTSHVSSAVCIEDDFTADPPGWSCVGTRTGAHGPASNRWGDYLRVRPAYPADRNWVATNFTLQASTATGSAEPRHIVFGRQRDTFDFFRWFNR
jgi:hypothetical protein